MDKVVDAWYELITLHTLDHTVGAVGWGIPSQFSPKSCDYTKEKISEVSLLSKERDGASVSETFL